MNVVEILRDLVAIPSVSSLSNAPLLGAVEEVLKPLGWSLQRFVYTAFDGQEKANLLAIPNRFEKNLPEIELLFVCHSDTVPYKSGWGDATNLLEANGALHGCGACDVKGSLAGLLAAASTIDPADLPSSVAFAITAEEEVGCIGAIKLVRSGVVRPRRVIVCEPTSLRPATAGKGYGLAEVRVVGQEAHSAFPAKGASAILTAARFIAQLEEKHWGGDGATDARFRPPHTTFNVGTIQGGSAKNIVAGECRFLVEWRPIPSEDPCRGGEVLKRLASEVESERDSCKIEVNVMRADFGFDNKADSQLGGALAELLQRPETGISFGSEATRFAAIAEEIVVLGPGDMETAHSERECVPLAELEEWVGFVKGLMLGGVPTGTSEREWVAVA